MLEVSCVGPADVCGLLILVTININHCTNSAKPEDKALRVCKAFLNKVCTCCLEAGLLVEVNKSLNPVPDDPPKKSSLSKGKAPAKL